MLNWIKSIFGVVNNTIETLDVSGNEKARIQNQMAELQVTLSKQYVELEMAALETRAKLAAAEAQSDKWIVYSWRPITSLLLMGLLIAQSFGWIEFRTELWTLSTAFLGLTTAGRGLEKAARANKLGK